MRISEWSSDVCSSDLYDLASKIPGIAQSVLAGIRDHHEREDGSGYPSQLGRSHIHPYAKIVAIADLYDEALTINCDKPGKLSPYYSLEKLRNEIYRIRSVESRVGKECVSKCRT